MYLIVFLPSSTFQSPYFYWSYEETQLYLKYFDTILNENRNIFKNII